MQRVQRFCHCWKHRWNWLFGIACRTFSDCSWISVISWKLRPLKLRFPSWKQEGIARGQIRRLRRMVDHSHVFSGQKSLHRQSSLRRRFAACSGPQNALTCSIREAKPTSNPRNGVSSVFVEEYANISYVFVCASFRWTTWTLRIFHRSFPTFVSREPLKSSCSPHGIVTESSEHFMPFRCNFPESEAKFHTNALFFQIKPFAYNRKLRIALNTHKNKHSLRSNTKGYGGKTH
jgi:hypothetical protein